jgi:predicted phosphohydrolase
VKPLGSTPWVALAGGLLLGAFHTEAYPQEPDPAPESSDEVVLVGAGDIARCDMLSGAILTARLLGSIPGTIFTVGDHAYPSGSEKDFRECYEPTWGRYKSRTRPSPGNHDLKTKRGRYYYEFFGENAGPAGRGYYSYDLGSWHIISLNSEIDRHGKSDQARWLKEDLKASTHDCIAAYWHRPRFSSGPHGDDRTLHDIWRLLYDAGADIVMNGHDHVYERFAPQNPKGKLDPERGIRQFTIGTGGGGVYRFKRKARNSEVRDYSVYGVLKLTLRPGGYDWEFVPILGGDFTDSGSGTCSPRFPTENPASTN